MSTASVIELQSLLERSYLDQIAEIIGANFPQYERAFSSSVPENAERPSMGQEQDVRLPPVPASLRVQPFLEDMRSRHRDAIFVTGHPLWDRTESVAIRGPTETYTHAKNKLAVVSTHRILQYQQKSLQHCLAMLSLQAMGHAWGLESCMLASGGRTPSGKYCSMLAESELPTGALYDGIPQKYLCRDLEYCGACKEKLEAATAEA
jgi:hypothetical protein